MEIIENIAAVASRVVPASLAYISHMRLVIPWEVGKYIVWVTVMATSWPGERGSWAGPEATRIVEAICILDK